MKTLNEIKQMMAAGDTAQADKALKELLAKEPDNLQAKMLYGTCRQLLGDEETFKRIHDELAPEMEKLSGILHGEVAAVPPETFSLWKKYKTLWEYLILGALVLGTMAVGIAYFGRTVQDECSVLYGGAIYKDRPRIESRQIEVRKFSDVDSAEEFSDKCK